MNDHLNHVNKFSGKSRISSSSIDENSHSNPNGTSFSLQTFVDDIPFEFNAKYRIIHVPNIHLPDYDTQTIQNLLSTTIDFSLENRVIEEAIEDVKRKKKKIEADGISEPSLKSSKTLTANCPLSDSTSTSPARLSESVPTLPISLPPILHPTPPRPPVSAPVPPAASASASISAAPPSSSSAVISIPSPSTLSSFPSIHPTQSISTSHSAFSSPSNSYRLPSVRDIYWPTTNQQPYTIPTSTAHPMSISSNHYPLTVPTQAVSIPTPLRLPPSIPFNPPIITKPISTGTTVATTTMTPSSSSSSSSSSGLVATTASSIKNSINTNELAVTFDQTLTSDDPFHDAELKSLNDVVELNHLYSAFGSANTVRR